MNAENIILCYDISRCVKEVYIMNKKALRIVSLIMAVCMTLLGILVFDNEAVAADDSAKYAAVFDAKYYADKYPDLKAAYGYDANMLFFHFKYAGMKEGRQASEEFNVIAYKNRYADLRKLYGDDLEKYYIHYIYAGQKEGRDGKVQVIYNPMNDPSSHMYDVATIKSKLDTFRTIFYEGRQSSDLAAYKYAWHGGIVYEGHAYQAFAFKISDAAFGENHAREYSEFVNVRVGDIIRFKSANYAVVLSVLDGSVELVEADYDGKMHWGRIMTIDNLYEQAETAYTRYLD